MADDDYKDWLDKYAKDQGIDGDIAAPQVPQDLQDAVKYYQALGNSGLSEGMQAKVDEGEVDEGAAPQVPQDLQDAVKYYQALGNSELTPEMQEKIGQTKLTPEAKAHVLFNAAVGDAAEDPAQRRSETANTNPTEKQKAREGAEAENDRAEQWKRFWSGGKVDQAALPGTSGSTPAAVQPQVIGGGGNAAHVMADFEVPVDKDPDEGGMSKAKVPVKDPDEGGMSKVPVDPYASWRKTQKVATARIGPPTAEEDGAQPGGQMDPNYLLNVQKAEKDAASQPQSPEDDAAALQESAYQAQYAEQQRAKPVDKPDQQLGASIFGNQTTAADKSAADAATIQAQNQPPANTTNQPPKLYGTGGAPGQNAAATNAPLNIPRQRMVGGGYVDTLPPELRAQRNAYETQRHEANAQNELDARLANQQYGQFFAQRTAQLQADQAHQQQEMLRTQRAKEQAQADFDAAQKTAREAKIDPDKIFGKDGGGRLLAALGAGLGAFGAAITHTPNDALEMLKARIDASMSAQKAELNSEHQLADNAYKKLLEATGDEKSADSAFRQAGYQVAATQAEELDSKAKDSQLMMGLRQLQQGEAKDNLDYRIQTTGRVPQQVVGGIPKSVSDLAGRLMADSKGALTYQQALVKAGGAYGQNYGSDQGGTWGGTGQSGRQLGSNIKLQDRVAKVNEAIQSLDRVDSMMAAGGSLDANRTAEGKGLISDIRANMAFINAGKSPNETELHLPVLPEDPNAWGHGMRGDFGAAKEARRQLEAKKKALEMEMKQLTTNPGVPAPTADEEAAQAGATED